MKRAMLRLFITYLGLIWCFTNIYAQPTEYPIAWNEGSYEVEIAVMEGDSAAAVESAISSYMVSNSLTWLSLDSVESGSTSELWMLCFSVSDNTGGSLRYADFSPWNFSIIQAAQGVSGPSISEPAGGIATIYPGAVVPVSVQNLTTSVRVSLKRRPLTGGSWEHVDSLSLAAPSCSFQRVFEDGEYELAPLGIGFTIIYPDILYYNYTVSGLSQNISVNCNGDNKIGYITGYTDTGGVSHIVDASLVNQLQQLFSWYNTGGYSEWNPSMQLQVSLSSAQAVITACVPPNFGTARQWHTGLHISSSSDIAYSQPAGGDLLEMTCSLNSVRAQVSPSQYGVTYTVTDGEHNRSETGTGSTLNIYLSGSGMNGAYMVLAKYGGRTRLLGRNILDNDIPQVDGTVEASGANSIRTTIMNGTADNAVDVVYYDGLGREKQKIAVRASGDGLYDIVTPLRLDHLGREWRSYLPFADSGTAGAYRRYAFSDQAGWWYDQGYSEEGYEYAYSTIVLETSAAGRRLAYKHPGEDYHDASHDTDYSYVPGTLPKLSVSSSGTLTRSGYYSSESVSCTSVTDGDGHVTLSYIDREDRLLAEGPAGALTYYAYDTCGRLAWIISPKGMSSLGSGSNYTPDSDFAFMYCYVYSYDSRGRLAEKRIPGAEPQYFVYDSGDRIAFFQDGNMRDSGKWKAYFYDGCGRLVREDLRSAGSGVSRSSLQSGFDSSSVPTLYTTTSGVSLLRTYVYDAYPSGMNSGLAFQSNSVATQSALRSSPKGLQVYEDLAVLGTTQTASRARYYDREDRIIQEVTLYPDGSSLRISTSYDLHGNPIERISTHSDSNASVGTNVCLEDSFSYDSRGRLTQQQSQITMGYHTLGSVASWQFDEIGRPWKSTYGPANSPKAIQELSYTQQGWEYERTVKNASNNVIFSSALHYEAPLSDWGYSGVNNTVSWAGKITSSNWQHNGQAEKAYTYSYDSMSRMTTAQGYSGMSADYIASESFGYDLNCNIVSRTTYNAYGTPSVYPIELEGNQHTYKNYDSNGNVISDDVEAEYPVQVTYNTLNLPEEAYKEENYDINVLYLADGTKWSVIDSDSGDGYLYSGPFKYMVASNSKIFSGSSAAGGRFYCYAPYDVNNGYLPELHMQYFVTDYLNNTRVTVNESGTVLSRADYAPYGKIVWQSGVDIDKNAYLWTGKEFLPTFFDTPSYDSETRYLLTSGTFTSIDLLAEKYPGVSPYAYCAGDPVNFEDPEGRDKRIITKKNKIVISATYYVGTQKYDGFSAFEEFTKAAYYLNNKKGLKYFSESKEYDVVFDISVKPSYSPERDALKEEGANYVKIDPSQGYASNEDGLILGRADGGKLVMIHNKQIGNPFVILHEMLHSMGAAIKKGPNGEDPHEQKGLMAKSTNKQTAEITQKTINDIIDNE